MDLHHVDAVLSPTSRGDLATLGAGDALLAGGTAVMSDPGVGIRRLVDLDAMGWPDLTVVDAQDGPDAPDGTNASEGSDGSGGSALELAATCTIDRLVHAELPAQWRAAPLFGWCARSLLASFKIWYTATVGGNLCLALPAGAMISLCSALDASLLVWRADGTDVRLRTDELVTDNAQTSLQTGDVLRSIHFPARTLRQRVAMRRLSYAEYGRSGVVVIGRRTDNGVTISVSAATRRPWAIPVAGTAPDVVVDTCLSTLGPDAFFDDAHGTVAWRRSSTAHLIGEVVTELTAGAAS